MIKAKRTIFLLSIVILVSLLMPHLPHTLKQKIAQAQTPADRLLSSFPDSAEPAGPVTAENQPQLSPQSTVVVTTTATPPASAAPPNEAPMLQPLSAEDGLVTSQSCDELLQNGSFETDTAWLTSPPGNVRYDNTYYFTGQRSVYLSTSSQVDAFLWQPTTIPAEAENVALVKFVSMARSGDPGEIVVFRVYNASFTQVLSEQILSYPTTGTWYYYEALLPATTIAGQTVNVSFEAYHDDDAVYSQVYFDDASLIACDTSSPTPQPSPSPSPSPSPAPALDLQVEKIEVGQTLLAESDPVTGVPVPLIAEKPALVRVHVALGGTSASVDGVTGQLTIQDDLGQTHVLSQSLNGPIQVTQNPDPTTLDSTLNFLPDPNWLTGTVTIEAEIDPADTIFEADESNNEAAETKTFAPGEPLQIAWVWSRYAGNAPLDQNIAQTGDRMLRKFYPVGAQDVTYFFQPGFDQVMSGPLTIPNYAQYLNALNRFWLLQTFRQSWSSGSTPQRLYGWVSGNPTDICGVSDPLWVGGSGRVATGYGPICGAETFAHEIGHILDDQGLRHTYNLPNAQDSNCIASPAGPNPDHPIYPGYPPGSIGVLGLDVVELELLPPDQYYDFMSYCEPSWVSPYNYDKLAQGFPQVTAAGAVTALQAPQRNLLVSGTVLTPSLTVEWDPFYVITSTVTPDPSTGTAYCVEMRDAVSTTLESRCFDLSFINPENGEPTDQQTFALVVPYPTGTTEVVLTHNATPLNNVPVSPNAPTVQLTAPNGGESFTGTETITVTWTADDLDGDPLFYELAYSTDNGDSWISVGLDITQTLKTVDLSQLPGSSAVRFRVGASDGINTAYDESDDSLVVGDKPPVLVISTEETTLLEGEPLILQGSAYDLEDGPIDNNRLQWSSNLDGGLGTGGLVIANDLSIGEHTITLRAEDSDNNSGAATIIIIVQQKTKLYLPLILKPGGGSNTN